MAYVSIKDKDVSLEGFERWLREAIKTYEWRHNLDLMKINGGDISIEEIELSFGDWSVSYTVWRYDEDGKKSAYKIRANLMFKSKE